jgi:hypothetical protein
MAALHPPKPEAILRQWLSGVDINWLQTFTGLAPPCLLKPLVGMMVFCFND